MLNNISHQWRQPLNLVGLYVQEIGFCFEHGGCSDDYVGANVDKTMQTLQQLSRTIDYFRNFSTPDTERSLFNVGLVVENTLSILKDTFTQHAIGIEVRTDDGPKITGYPNEFSLVLLSILMNAKDAFAERSTVG